MSPLRVLLVDDEEELVSALSERLQLRGMDVQCATNGDDALQLVREQEFDVVVLDIKMPGMGGYEVMRQINQERPEAKILLITGHGALQEGEAGVKEGAFDYLVKPINIDSLIQKMNEAVNLE